MDHFIITYRIKHDDSYRTRYDAFIRRIKALSPDAFWNETSSFYALQSGEDAQEICRALCKDTDFDCTRDSVVVLNTTRRNMATSGAIQDMTRLKACIGFH
ncbi:hypothetical protein NYP20_14110 [Pseudomonas sp. N3-W]|jgi:hypothetical protein|uniref:Uncharacterized protein n=1 Tax=Pseudomonas fungipugnans TaxID=3024217 RepID=A0ABT6QHR2_9PSED|nr:MULTISPECIES: hypothetical protein [unclassified Pseudomonas]MDI2590325.1 hypothetical protein [Pseudomonas sp. 681]UWF52027.1 hypothetical protein NYP20_14110 [Pseudomonas sp. N3-W]